MKKIVFTLLLAAPVTLPARQAAAQVPATSTGTCQSILVPSYFAPAPAGSAWDRAIADTPWSAKTTRTLVMNPDSGPGPSFSADFAAAIRKVKVAGGITEAYVWTNYGAVPLTEAEKQVDLYISRYGTDALNGIFVDTMSAEGPLVETYYQPLLTYITRKLPNATVTLNPGVYPDPKYASMTTATATSSFNLVVFEQSLANFNQKASAPPAWMQNFPASRFIAIVYDTPEAQLPGVLKLAAQRNMGGIYITDEVMPDPYRGLPAYWKKLVALTQAACR